MLLGQRRRLGSLNLRDDANGNLTPFGQRAERPAQAVQRHMRQSGCFDCLVVRVARFGNPTLLGVEAVKHPR